MTRPRPRTIVAALAAAVLGGVAVVAMLLNRPGPPLAEPATVTVREGERIGDIARGLVAQGVLRSPLLFVAWARVTGRDHQVHWGDFRIAEPLSPRELLERLVGPPDALHAVTIPEGLTAQEVVSLLAAAGLGSEETFQSLLARPAFPGREGLPPEGAEGYLFPDTYSFPLATPPERVLGIMVHRFHEVFTPEMAERAARLGLTPHQAVTLASLVEEETAPSRGASRSSRRCS